MNYIDLSTYPRRAHYEFFKNMAFPYVGVTSNVDVTGLLRKATDLGGSPFLAYLWAAATAANQVPEMRQRIVDDQIIQFDHCDTSHTVALEDGTFCNCRTDCRRSFEDFLVYGKQQQIQARNHCAFVSHEDDETDLIFVSCTPWMTFTQVIQPVPIPADSNPRLVFGKFIPQGDRTLMPLHIQCNHALVDGLHIGKFFQAFEEISNSL